MRHGIDCTLPKVRDATGQLVPVPHSMPIVYREMLLQITRDYPGLPDPRTLTMAEIRFFFEGVRAELRRATSTSPNDKG